MTDKIIHILSNIIKTIITAFIAIIAGILFGLLFNGLLTDNLRFIIGVCTSIFVFWKLCPYDTKQWILTWTKPAPQK